MSFNVDTNYRFMEAITFFSYNVFEKNNVLCIPEGLHEHVFKYSNTYYVLQELELLQFRGLH